MGATQSSPTHTVTVNNPNLQPGAIHLTRELVKSLENDESSPPPQPQPTLMNNTKPAEAIVTTTEDKQTSAIQTQTFTPLDVETDKNVEELLRHDSAQMHLYENRLRELVAKAETDLSTVKQEFDSQITSAEKRMLKMRGNHQLLGAKARTSDSPPLAKGNVCTQVQEAVARCYEKNAKQPLNCSSEVGSFIKCVETEKRQLSKKPVALDMNTATCDFDEEVHRGRKGRRFCRKYHRVDKLPGPLAANAAGVAVALLVAALAGFGLSTVIRKRNRNPRLVRHRNRDRQSTALDTTQGATFLGALSDKLFGAIDTVMGATQPTFDRLRSAVNEKVKRDSRIAQLSRVEFGQFVETLNSIMAELCSEGDASQFLMFDVRDDDVRHPLLWKAQIKVVTTLVDKNTGEVITKRRMNLITFIRLYDEILKEVSANDHATKQNTDRHSGSIRIFDSTIGETENATDTGKSDGGVDCSVADGGDDVIKLDGRTELEIKQPDDVDECAICFDNKSNIVLPCMHEFCDECIRQWSHECPLCRAVVTSDDGWHRIEQPRRRKKTITDEAEASVDATTGDNNERTSATTSNVDVDGVVDHLKSAGKRSIAFLSKTLHLDHPRQSGHDNDSDDDGDNRTMPQSQSFVDAMVVPSRDATDGTSSNRIEHPPSTEQCVINEMRAKCITLSQTMGRADPIDSDGGESVTG